MLNSIVRLPGRYEPALPRVTHEFVGWVKQTVILVGLRSLIKRSSPTKRSTTICRFASPTIALRDLDPPYANHPGQHHSAKVGTLA